MEYTTKENLEAYLLLNIDPDFAEQITKWIKSASLYVRTVTNREWLASETATTKIYSGNGSQELIIDDYVGDLVLSIGDNWNENMVVIDEADYYLEGTSIFYKSDVFPCGNKNIAVTARFGYSATVPEDIELATTIFASGIALANMNSDGEVSSESIGNYKVTYKDDKHKDDFAMANSIIESRKLILI